MRRQSLLWTFLVLAIVLSAYGGFSVFSNIGGGKTVPVLGLVFLVVGALMLLTLLVLFLISLFQKKKGLAQQEIAEAVKEPKPEEEPKPDIKEEPKVEIKEDLKPVKPSEPAPTPSYTYEKDVTYRPSTPRRPRHEGSGYVRKSGYGPVLRVEEEQILDMRTNTYYRIEGRIVNQSGSGPVYEISGNSIKLAFGGYLYEVSGGSISKTYGGHFASYSGRVIQTADLSERYEVPSSLSKGQLLTIVALLFGSY